MVTSSNLKGKFETYAEVPIQFLSENSEKCAANVAVECDSEASMERIKEEDSKPIYFKRV